MVRLYASRTDPYDGYDPALSAFQSAKQSVVASIVKGRSWTGMRVYEERDDRLVEMIVEGELEHIVNLLCTLRCHGVGWLYLEAGTPEELATLRAEFSGFLAFEMALAD